MKLILLRHFKSSWDNPTSDKDRVLNERGRKAAGPMGKWIAQFNPDQALVSSATRTRESWARLGLTCPHEFHDDLYLAEPAEILSRLKRSGVGDTILIIAHNPGIAELAESMVSAPPTHPDFYRYPTGACLVAKGSLDDLQAGEMTVGNFAVPKDLT